MMGTWVQTIALSWFIYGMTGSALSLGIVGFLSQIPVFFITPFAGVLIDRWNRYYVLIVTQVLAMLQAFILSALVLSGKVLIIHIFLLCLFFGLVTAFQLIANQTFIFNIIERREDLGNAIALNSSLFNLARMLGPSAAGILIASIGEGMCFFINGTTYLVVIIALLCMRVKPQQIVTKQRHIMKEFKEGFFYISNSVSIKSIILLQGFITLIGMPFQVLMPVFVKEILGEGPHILGYIIGFSGSGAIIGTIFLALRKDVLGLARLIPLATGLLGLGLIASSLSRLPWLSMLFALFTGFGGVLQYTTGNTILQRIVNDEKRGRVMSIYMVAFWGVYPLGNLLAGVLANMLGVANEFMISGILCIGGSLVFAAKYPSITASISRHLNIIGDSVKTDVNGEVIGG